MTYTIKFFVNGRDGLKETKAKGEDDAEAVRAALGYMPEQDIVIIEVKEVKDGR